MARHGDKRVNVTAPRTAINNITHYNPKIHNVQADLKK